MLYLIDASIFIFRAYHTVPNSLTDRDGNPVNALHGFARFIGDLIERVGPTHIAVAFDASLVTSFRNELYPAYKAHREPAPADLKPHWPCLLGARAKTSCSSRATRISRSS
jgi:DNA polymerase-1